jgi:Acetyltransferase (GNAT) domain
VILVAQSLGGFTAPLVCARARVRMLVFVNAMIPLPGESAGEWWANTGWEEAVVVDDEVAGTIGSWGDPGEREVTNWIGRSYWGKGDRDLRPRRLLTVDPSRPLHARVAYDNVASRRVLEKCGFRVIATETLR